jgi:hypothetical protein
MESSMPFDFQQLANFRLAKGCHKQPNARGDICLMEAAAIAAGFAHRAVIDAFSLPRCFSVPLADYAIHFNDMMPAWLRNELLTPFVTRLAGTSDHPLVETERAEFIVIATARRIVAAEYDEIWHEPTVAAKCRAARSLPQVYAAMTEAIGALPSDCAKWVTDAHNRCFSRPILVGASCAAAAKAAAHAFRDHLGRRADRKIWELAAGILDDAIRLGRHDGIDDHEAAVERLERAKVLSAPVWG